MFVKITNGVVDQFPYTVGQLRKDNPNTSFPKEVPDHILKSFGVFPVEHEIAPSFDHKTQRVETAAFPTLVSGHWVLSKTVVDKTPEQYEADKASAASSVRSERNKKIASSDWTQLADAPVDKAVWATYRQALRDIPEQAGFPWNVQWPEMP